MMMQLSNEEDEAGNSAPMAPESYEMSEPEAGLSFSNGGGGVSSEEFEKSA